MAVRVRSYSKINLGLRIGPPRPDRYHGLCTLYQTVALHDVVTVSAKRAAETRITLASNHEGVPTDDRNTAWKMVTAALQRMNLAAEVEIHIQKNLPVQGGMGAGSANAVAALLGLERDLGEALPGAERIQMAGEVGSDVPLFLVGGTSVGLSRGEIVVPYPDLPETWCVMAVPSVGVSTPAAFKEWDEQYAEEHGPQDPTRPPENGVWMGHPNAGSTVTAPPDRLEELSRVYASVFSPAGCSDAGASGVSFCEGDLAGSYLSALVRTGIANDFQEVVFQQHPPLRDILHALEGDESTPDDERALVAMLSGSGSSLYGLYRNEADAKAAQQRVQQQGTRALLTTTLPRSQYWKTMFEGL